jgi:hypothetical protein
MNFLTNFFGARDVPAVGSKVKAPSGKMVTVKKSRDGRIYISYVKKGEKKKKYFTKAVKKERKTHKVHSKLSPKRKGVMSDAALVKHAKSKGIDVYKVSKGRKKLVSRSTLLKRLREAGEHVSPNKKRMPKEESDFGPEEMFPESEPEDEDEITMFFGKKKRKANPNAKKAMRLMYSKGISLKEAWAIVKGKSKGKGTKGTTKTTKGVRKGSKVKAPNGRIATVKKTKEGKLYINYTKNGKKYKKMLK